MTIPLQYSLRSVRARPATTLAAAAGMGLVVFVLASALMLSRGLRRAFVQAAGPDVAVVLRQGADSELSSSFEEQQLQIVLSADQVARTPAGAPAGIGEVVVLAMMEKAGTDRAGNVVVRGVTEGALAFRPGVHVVAGRAPRPGTEEAMVGAALRGRFDGLDVGGHFTLREDRPIEVVGVFEDAGSLFESEVWAGLDLVRSASGREGLVSSARVRLRSAEDLERLRAAVEGDVRLGLTVLSERAFHETQAEGTSKFILALGALVAAFFSIGAMIGALVTMHASVADRRREIGTLRALGFSRASVVLSFLVESVALALCGGASGAAASLALGLVRFSTINFATWGEIVFTFDPTWQIMLVALGGAAAMGLVGGLLPALQASRMSPVEAMRA
jgi:putative ABC transport system permease protein